MVVEEEERRGGVVVWFVVGNFKPRSSEARRNNDRSEKQAH